MEKNYCYIISAMRSGSTLLKALIATRPDCSHLPETPFNKYNIIEDNAKIIVLKKPAGFDEYEYPQLQQPNFKKIILIRNPYDTVRSLKEMYLSRKQNNPVRNDDQFLVSYWYMVYNNIIEKKIFDSSNTLIVRYENLIDHPIEETARIFKFIGSEYLDGTDTYFPPRDYNWAWGNDDGGDVIKTLKVRRSTKKRLHDDLLLFVNNSEQVKKVLKYYGYSTLVFS